MRYREIGFEAGGELRYREIGFEAGGELRYREIGFEAGDRCIGVPHESKKRYIALRAIQNSKFKIHSEAMTRFKALVL